MCGAGICVAVECGGESVCVYGGCLSGTATCGSPCAWSASTRHEGVVNDCGVCDCGV